jgi:FlaA1/EpsC-like NDP-sugar epimerase
MYRRFLIILVHLILVLASYVLSFFLRFELTLPPAYADILLKTMPLLALIRMVFFYYFGLFSGLWRYTSIEDLWKIIKAIAISSVVFILGIIFTNGLVDFPRSVFILDWILCTSFICGVRLFSRLFKEVFKAPYQKITKRLLIVGAGQAGVMVLKEYRNNPHMNAGVVGFIDDDPVKRNLHVHGVKVLGAREDIADIVRQYQIEEIVIAIPSAKGEQIRGILSYCEIPNIKIKIIPGLHMIISGDLELKPREIKPEDLLGREIVRVDEKEIGSYIIGKRILVTGAGGSIGSELCRQIAKFSPEQLVLFDHNENDVYFLVVEFKTKHPEVKFKTIIGDIKDIGLLKHVFSSYKPQVVFHSAAHKHVPLMEENPVAAVKNNVIGSRNLIYAAEHYKVERLVLISTDKAVNPTSVMGMTKRISEMILQAKAKNSRTRFMAVRFGNVIGSDGSVVPLFKKQIEEGGPVTITDPEAKRYFMSVTEAASLVLQAGAIGKGGEIFILDMGEQIKITDLARNLIALSGLKPGKDISIQFVGLREGEKLSEEMLLDTEHDKLTKHDKIYITQPDEFDPIKLRRQIKELERLANIMDETKIKVKIKEIVS